jgi:hypothetical protein
MRAIRHVAAAMKVPLSRKVFLTGYSQGGHTILGTQKIVESENASEFDVIANSPGSGFYALVQSVKDSLRKPNGLGSVFYAYLLPGYNKVYGNLYPTGQAGLVFKRPYAGYVDTLLPVHTYAQAAALNGKTLPLRLSALLQPAVFDDVLNDPKSAVRADLGANDLLDGWTPKAPVYFCGGSRDPVVEYKNSILATAYFKKRGARVGLLDVNPEVPPSLPRSKYHDAVFVLCHTFERRAILDSLVKR